VATIQRAVDEGVDFIHSANMYGPFIHKGPVDIAIEDRRHHIVLATKLGIMRTADPLARGSSGRPVYVMLVKGASVGRSEVQRE
jgi:aryl-alcohol dehydrogenase-like predicted oxidoreductase